MKSNGNSISRIGSFRPSHHSQKGTGYLRPAVSPNGKIYRLHRFSTIAISKRHPNTKLDLMNRDGTGLALPLQKKARFGDGPGTRNGLPTAHRHLLPATTIKEISKSWFRSRDGTCQKMADHMAATHGAAQAAPSPSLVRA